MVVFPDAIATQQGDFFAARNRRREIPDHRLVAVGFREPLHFQWMPPGRTFVLEPDIWPLDVRFREFGSLQPLHFFLARGGLRRSECPPRTWR